MGRFWVLVGLLSAACQPDSRQRTRSHEPIPAFYHWKSIFTRQEQALFDSSGAQSLYVRFFDVDWDAATRQPVPRSIVRFRTAPTARTVVPVVFITNRTLLNLPPANVPDLARRLVQKVQQLAQAQRLTYPELQFDCDWTRSTRSRYFALLKAINQQARVPLSATIRLHQVKFMGQTGVPPVRRGMLMAYNIGDWKRPDTRNSILDLTDLNAYADYLPGYPLPLDIALPLFRWTVMFRNGRVLALRNHLDAAQVRTQPFISPQPTPTGDSTHFIVSRDTTVWGVSLRRGDQLRTEAVSPALLLAAKELLLARLPDETRTFTLYHLDSTVLAHYPHAVCQILFALPAQTP